MATKTASLQIGIDDKKRAQAARSLNRLLADQFVLSTKTRNFHWNVVGDRFASLHSFFETQYDQLGEMMDETAEFSRFYGLRSLGTLTEFQAATALKESPGKLPTADGMLTELANDHQAIIRFLREEIDNASEKLKLADLADFLTQNLQKHSKMAWMLRAHSEG
jgi:starvation-inducible DNA-binding protein